MKYELELSELPCGYAASSTKEGQTAEIIVKHFSSSEDGDDFIRILESFPSQLLAMAPEEKVLPSQVDNLLAIISKDKKAKVFINEIAVKAQIRPKRSIKAGENVLIDDVASIERIDFDGLQISNSVGIIYLFSSGWRKGVFFDFAPLAPKGAERTYDVGVLLGKYFAYLNFQSVLQISEKEWTKILRKKFFPFTALSVAKRQKFLNYIRNNWRIDSLFCEFEEVILASLSNFRERWKKWYSDRKEYVSLHRALDRFSKKDYISCCSILYPRIEGILRNFHRKGMTGKGASEKNLIQSLLRNSEDGGSLLIPEKFALFLEKVYFSSFTPNKPIPLSRHSVAHGEVPIQSFNKRGAVTIILTLDQIGWFLSKKKI